MLVAGTVHVAAWSVKSFRRHDFAASGPNTVSQQQPGKRALVDGQPDLGYVFAAIFVARSEGTVDASRPPTTRRRSPPVAPQALAAPSRSNRTARCVHPLIRVEHGLGRHVIHTPRPAPQDEAVTSGASGSLSTLPPAQGPLPTGLIRSPMGASSESWKTKRVGCKPRRRTRREPSGSTLATRGFARRTRWRRTHGWPTSTSRRWRSSLGRSGRRSR